MNAQLYCAQCSLLQGIIGQKYYIEGHKPANATLRGAEPPEVDLDAVAFPVFHGRGIFISENGRVVGFSRDKYGRFVGVDGGACVENTW